MSKPLVISLSSALPRSGKDTVAARLKEYLESRGKTVQLLSFAKHLRDSVAACYGLSFTFADRDNKDALNVALTAMQAKPSIYRDWLFDTYPQEIHLARSARWHLQQYGTLFMREHLGRPNHWLEAVVSQINDPDVIYIITDTRFENELNCANSLGYTFNIEPVGFPESHPVNDQFEQFKSMKDTEGRLVGADFDADIENIYGEPNHAVEEIVTYCMTFAK